MRIIVHGLKNLYRDIENTAVIKKMRHPFYRFSRTYPKSLVNPQSQAPAPGCDLQSIMLL